MVGLVAGVAIFVVDYSRIDIVNARLSGQVLRSSVELSGERQKVLAAHGDAILILRLQGYIFFGTADRLRERILSWVETAGPTPITFLLIDFRRASGMDSSAAMSFRKLTQLTEQTDFRLVLTGLSQELRQTLERGGVRLDPAGPVRAYPTLDRGLRWCEQKLLGRVAPLLVSDDPYQIQEQLLSGLDRGEELLQYMTRVTFPQDHALIEQGKASEEMYFIELRPAERASRDEHRRQAAPEDAGAWHHGRRNRLLPAPATLRLGHLRHASRGLALRPRRPAADGAGSARPRRPLPPPHGRAAERTPCCHKPVGTSAA